MDDAISSLCLVFLFPEPHGGGCPKFVANPPSSPDWYEEVRRLFDAMYPEDLDVLLMPHTPWQFDDDVPNRQVYEPFGDELVVVLTPTRNYEFRRSKYGNKTLNGMTSAPSAYTLPPFQEAWKRLTGEDFVVEFVEVEEELEEESEGDEDELDSNGDEEEPQNGI